MVKLLLVEDDLILCDALAPDLRKAGYAVELAHNGIDALHLASEENFDAVILDLGLPEKNGLQVLETLRQQKNLTPVLILTARDSWHERVDGLKAGADDYVGKPFHTEELLARLDAVLRRHHGQACNQISVGQIVLDTDTRELKLDQQTILLSANEFKLLRFMLLHPNQVLSKSCLSEHIYEDDHLRDSNVIEVYINKLRQYLGKDRIRTLRGQGYQLLAEA
ncbi:MAG: response regulator transcription factor [Oceanospirillum sp.]|nr:response regulator transcription factor [Oceanospirillum sp.]